MGMSNEEKRELLLRAKENNISVIISGGLLATEIRYVTDEYFIFISKEFEGEQCFSIETHEYEIAPPVITAQDLAMALIHLKARLEKEYKVFGLPEFKALDKWLEDKGANQ